MSDEPKIENRSKEGVSERLALPGHDRDVARAIRSQAVLRSSPIDVEQADRG